MSARAAFLPGIQAPEPAPPDSLCFAFQGSRLLVRRTAGAAPAACPAASGRRPATWSCRPATAC